MAKNITTKSKKKDVLNIQTKDLMMAQLYTSKPEKGYVRKNDLPSVGVYSLRNKALELPRVIIVKKSLSYKGRLMSLNLREFLTDTPIASYIVGPSILKHKIVARTPRTELDTFVYVNYQGEPSVGEVFEYIYAHRDIDAYREELKELKKKGRINHKAAKKKEKEQQPDYKVIVKK